MKKFFILLSMLLFAAVFSSKTYAQIDILGKIKEKVEKRADEKTDEAIDKGLDEIEKKAENQDDEAVQEDQADAEKPEAKTVKAKRQPADEPTAEAVDVQKPAPVMDEGLKSFSKFDFVPGEKVLFFEDFANDNVGDFPARWNTNGVGEVVTMNKYPGKWLKAHEGSLYVPEFPKPFPDNYTIEFNMIFNGPEDESLLGDINLCLISTGGDSKEYLKHAYPYFGSGASVADLTMSLSNNREVRVLAENGVDGNNSDVNSSIDHSAFMGKYGKIVKISIAVQKMRCRLWIDDKKIYDLPKFLPPAIYDIFKIGLWGFAEESSNGSVVYFSNVRFAVGAPDMRSKLITEGKLVTRGITFDTGSDKIKSESYGTLKEIAGVLKENPTVSVKIVGHTDSDGSDASNLELSKKRSASVKTALNTDFGIELSRMQTDGKGESEPVADNKTSEGKSNNRRVEFIKM